jgi:DnaJ-class molecular chaperone
MPSAPAGWRTMGRWTMAEQDPYKILGVKRDASQDEIQRAYRKLAKQHHPDLNPGNKDAEERFKAISGANDLLSDPEKRARFDRGEIDASGAERPPERGYYRRHAEGAQGPRYHRAGSFSGEEFGGQNFGGEDIGDIFADLFGERRGRAGGGAGVRMRGPDRAFTLTIDFVEAATGTKKRLSLGPDSTLDVTIPAGFQDGQILRLKGKGEPGYGGGPPGDALIEVHVAPHPFFRRDGNDIHVEVPATVKEAVLGAKIMVPTVHGPVSVTVPKHSDAGKTLRLKGRGIAPPHGEKGDQYVTIKIVIGTPADPALETFLQSWEPRDAVDPRRGMFGT